MELSFTFVFCEICNVCRTYETKKSVPFFYKERKRMQRSLRSFIKNGKECKDQNFLLKRTEKNAMIGTFFYKEWKRT